MGKRRLRVSQLPKVTHREIWHLSASSPTLESLFFNSSCRRLGGLASPLQTTLPRPCLLPPVGWVRVWSKELLIRQAAAGLIGERGEEDSARGCRTLASFVKRRSKL